MEEKFYSEEKLKEIVEVRKMNPFQVLCALVMGALIKHKILSQGVINVICKDVGPRFAEVLLSMGYIGNYEQSREGLKSLIKDVCRAMKMDDITRVEDVDEGVAVIVDSKLCRLCIRTVGDVPRSACIFPVIFEAMANYMGIPCKFNRKEDFKSEGLCKVIFEINV